MTFPTPSAPGGVSYAGSGRAPGEQVRASGARRCGMGESLGTELGEARAESRRGRTFPRLIAEGSLSHGVHVRALQREREESLGNQPSSGENVHP